MKLRMVSLTGIFLLLLTVFLFSGCNVFLVPADEVIESGETEVRQYELDEFTEVDINSAFAYEIKQADDWSISITADSNLFENISVTRAGRVLDINITKPDGIFLLSITHPKPKVVITMPELTGLDISGATDGTVIGFKSDGNIDISVDGASKVELSGIVANHVLLEVSGASSVTGDTRVDSIELDVDSASKVRLQGSADLLAFEGSGASQADLSYFITRDADVSLSGASKGTISLDGKLDVRVSGASTLEYIGDPEIGVLDVSGGSKFRKK